MSSQLFSQQHTTKGSRHVLVLKENALLIESKQEVGVISKSIYDFVDSHSEVYEVSQYAFLSSVLAFLRSYESVYCSNSKYTSGQVRAKHTHWFLPRPFYKLLLIGKMFTVIINQVRYGVIFL